MSSRFDMKLLGVSVFCLVFLSVGSGVANAADACSGNDDLSTASGFQSSWIGTATVTDIKRGTPDGSGCNPTWYTQYIVDTSPGNDDVFCETSGDIPVPNNFRISTVEYNNGINNKRCGSGFDQFKIKQYVAGTSTDTYLALGGYQKIPSSHVLSTYSSRSCEPNVDSNCNTLASVSVKANNAIWCNTNGISGAEYVSSEPPTGFFLDAELPNNCVWKTGTPIQYYGQSFRLKAYSSATSGYTCAKSYNDIDAPFVATLASTSVNCGGNGYRYWSVTKPGSGTTACMIGTSYDHPDGFVITNKQGSNTQCPDGRYTITEASGSSITGVCPQSRLPNGYYLSSGSWASSTCNLIFSRISGNGPVSDVCLYSTDQSSTYPGWYPSNATANTHCESGFTFTLSLATSASHDPVKWFNSNWVPQGYVIVPSSGTCSPIQMNCNKIQLAEENLAFCYGNNNYAIPAGWKKGDVLTGTPTCPNQLSKYKLLIDRPPPPNVAGSPAPFVDVEPVVLQKPVSMPAIGVTCPGSGC